MIAYFSLINLSLPFYPLAMENDDSFLKSFGAHLRKIRESKGISSAELARRCFMDRGNYTRYETGKTNATLTSLKKISQALGVSVKDLVDFE